MNRFLKQAIDDKEEMIGSRRFLHRNPEIRDDLPITAKFVSEKLTEYGIPNKEICKCGFGWHILRRIERLTKMKVAEILFIDKLEINWNNFLSCFFSYRGTIDEESLEAEGRVE